MDEDKKPLILGPGYHTEGGGILVTGKTEGTLVPLAEAVSVLKNLLVDFLFASPGDRSRALAAMTTPAMRIGGLFRGPNPVQAVEADQSQAGKGYFQNCTRSIYGETAYVVAKRDGGVGSVDESLAAALISGRPFIALDNVRGRFDSQYIESAVTEFESVPVRVPHKGEVQVDASAVTFQMTSNGVEATEDFARRSSIIRLRKQAKDYRFFNWAEGSLIEHIRAHSGYYLSCVLSVINEWIEAGQPRLSAEGHDFRDWAGSLNWIVQKVFGEAPLMDGHEAAQQRVSNAAMTWLRFVCIAAERSGRLDIELSASGIADLCEDEGVDLPGLQSTAAEDQVPKHIGKLLARCFRSSVDSIEIDGFSVVRSVQHERDAYRHNLPVKRYRISRSVRTEGDIHRENLEF